MFTGIITETGTVADISRRAIAIKASALLLRTLKRGESIAVDGACLTVVKQDRKKFMADVMPETFRRTALRDLESGDTVNLELPATPSSILSGHIVQGHVDGTGVLEKIAKDDSSYILTISAPPALARSVVEKGSIALNGISLTIINARQSSFTIGIIPHTWETTGLRRLKRGDRVNLETDVLGKYVERLIAKKHI